jgi:hypothetical protein
MSRFIQLFAVAAIGLVALNMARADDDSASWRVLGRNFHWALTTGKMPKGAKVRIKIVEASGPCFVDVGTSTGDNFTGAKQFKDVKMDDVYKWSVPSDSIIGVGGMVLDGVEKRDGYHEMRYRLSTSKLVLHVKVIGGF